MLRPSCNEQLPADLYPDGCNAQVQSCGRLEGHDGEHRAWVQMAPVIVDWPATQRADDDSFDVEAPMHSGRDDASVQGRSLP